MRFTLELVLKRSERSFERVIGLLGRRGCELVAVRASMSEDERVLRVSLTLESSRRAETLARQLDRLVEVESVRIPD